MATCPRCLGPLTENHRCPRRGILTRVTDALSWALGGGVLGALLTYALQDAPAPALVLAAAALGAVLGSAVRQAIGPRF